MKDFAGLSHGQLEKARPARLCHVGGEDVYARIPMLKALEPGFTPSAIGSGGADRFAAADIAFRSYALNRGISPLADRRSVAQLAAHFAELKPDIVHAFDTKPAIYAMDAGARAGVPVKVRTITGLGYLFSEDTWQTRLLKPVWAHLQRKAGAQADWTVFQNDADRDIFLERGLVRVERTSLIGGSGVDVEGLLAQRQDPEKLAALRAALGLGTGPVALMTARLVRQKGVREFIAAAGALQDMLPEARFLLVGPSDGEGRDAITEAELARAPSNVIATGFRRDVPALLQLADVMVLPSYYREGVPRVLMEAALFGVPIITTDMPGCRDVVDHGRLGRLVPTRDAPALAHTMHELLTQDPAERRDLGARCGAFIAQNFSLSHIVSQYRSLYGALLDRAGIAQTG